MARNRPRDDDDDNEIAIPRKKKKARRRRSGNPLPWILGGVGVVILFAAVAAVAVLSSRKRTDGAPAAPEQASVPPAPGGPASEPPPPVGGGLLPVIPGIPAPANPPPDPPGWEGWSELAGRWENRDKDGRTHTIQFGPDRQYRSTTFDGPNSNQMVTETGRITTLARSPSAGRNGERGAWAYTVTIDLDARGKKKSKLVVQMFIIDANKELFDSYVIENSRTSWFRKLR